MIFKHRSSVLSVLICLTLLSLSTQLVFFLIHNHTAEILDALVGSSIPGNIFNTAVLLPLSEFIGFQILAYLLLIGFLGWLSLACSAPLRRSAYSLGIFFWLIANLAIFLLNTYFFPDSFFAFGLLSARFIQTLLVCSLVVLSLATLLACDQAFRCRRYRLGGCIFLSIAAVFLLTAFINQVNTQAKYQVTGTAAKPNIIFIGVDSLRPDYTSYFGGAAQHTPHIDQFLKNSVTFSEVYTPLARTFPAWTSILTGKHPKHSHARINLGYAQPVLSNATLAKRLQAAHYETIYATDEKRFSNITRAYGFDQIVGPRMGLNDFILGGLSDFPLTNLLINLPLGRFLFPFNYANRAAAITYEPDSFLQLVKTALQHRKAQPLFLALHFCLSHWPYTWAQDRQAPQALANERYRSAVTAADQQLGRLLQILKENGLLEHSWVVLLSDHGTSFGLPGDRFLEKSNYQGFAKRLAWVTRNKLSQPQKASLDLETNYSLNTAYGQGTDILSLKQYQVLLAFAYFSSQQHATPALSPHRVFYRSSLLDLAPTILALLHLAPMQPVDGLSLEPLLFAKTATVLPTRPLYLETGYSLSDIETNDIKPEKVIDHSLHLYQVNPKTGYLYIKPSAERAVLENKQRAILWGPWLLARYPASKHLRLLRAGEHLSLKEEAQPAYYLLANLETHQWTLGLDTPFAKGAPIHQLQKQLQAFYGDELLYQGSIRSNTPSFFTK